MSTEANSIMEAVKILPNEIKEGFPIVPWISGGIVKDLLSKFWRMFKNGRLYFVSLIQIQISDFIRYEPVI